MTEEHLVDMEFANFEHLCGWSESRAALANQSIPHDQFLLTGTGPVSRRMALFAVVRQVLGTEPENINQLIGDCVSWGAKHAVEYLQCFQLAMGNMEQFRLIFSPYHYGTGRVLIGGEKGSYSDGSVGIWQVQAIQKFGVVCLDDPGVPPYSAQVAKQFGADAGNVLEKFEDVGKQHLLKSFAKVSTWEQLVQAITNGFPVTVASNQGFTMTARSDGFHAPSGHWGHQMCITFVDDDGGNIEPHAGILNSWGDVHGQIIDFRDPSLKWAIGMLRARKSVIEHMLAADDSYAYSSFNGFPAQILPESFFSNF